MTTYQTALELASQRNFGELLEFLSEEISEERLMHTYAMAQAELALEVGDGYAQCHVVRVISYIQNHSI